MSQVLIVFQANTEPVEQLALAVAVGAVEAEGSIRLRRLTVPGAPEVGHKSYGRLQAADLLWADVIVVGLEDADPNPGELGPLFELLREADLTGRRGWSFGAGGPDLPRTEAQLQVAQALQAAGVGAMSLVRPAGSEDLMEEMKEYGRAAAARE
jgi:hypothetical protein